MFTVIKKCLHYNKYTCSQMPQTNKQQQKECSQTLTQQQNKTPYHLNTITNDKIHKSTEFKMR